MAGRRGQGLGRAVPCGLGACALGDECGRGEVLRDGNELAAILLLPGAFVVTAGAEDLEVDVETLADGLVDVHAMAGPGRSRGVEESRSRGVFQLLDFSTARLFDLFHQ